MITSGFPGLRGMFFFLLFRDFAFAFPFLGGVTAGIPVFKWVYAALEWIGGLSFELFMAHLLMIDLRDYLCTLGIIENTLGSWFWAMLASLPFALLLKLIAGRIRSFIGKRNS